jgi:hypothetical protein
MTELTITTDDIDCTEAELAKLQARRVARLRSAQLDELTADLRDLRTEERRRAEATALAAIARSSEHPSAADDVLFIHLSHRGVLLTEATVSSPTVTLSNLAVSYLPLDTVGRLPETWPSRHRRELRERSLLVVFDVLTSDPLAAIVKAIKSPLQDAGGRERADFECSDDRGVAAQHLAELLRATRDRGTLERWRDAAGDAPHAGEIQSRLNDLFGRGSSGGLGFTTSAHSVGLKGI